MRIRKREDPSREEEPIEEEDRDPSDSPRIEGEASHDGGREQVGSEVSDHVDGADPRVGADKVVG